MFILNSKLINADNISIDINSSALNYGYSLFETVKIYKSSPQLLEEHIRRLNRSLKSLSMDYSLDTKDIYDDISELILSLEVESGAVKILVYESEGLYNTLISYSNRVYPKELYKRGYKIMLSPYKTNEHSIFTYHKTSNYGENILALRDAKARGYDEVIFKNFSGNISEGSLSNVFLVRDNIVYTSTIESGILAGVMRALVIDILKDMGIKIIEKNISYDELAAADEIFLSNSLMNIMPVSKLDGKIFDLDNYKIYGQIKKQLHLSLGEDYFG